MSFKYYVESVSADISLAPTDTVTLDPLVSKEKGNTIDIINKGELSTKKSGNITIKKWKIERKC